MRSRSIGLRAFAKINLVLDLVGRRPDGYTQIETIFQTISLCDRLRIEQRPGLQTRIGLRMKGGPSDLVAEENLAYRAAMAWVNAAGWSGELQIDLEKEIPAQAGLGGGSADAAAVLRALGPLTGIDLSLEQLLSLARSLGADVPFQLEGGLALGRGRGDEIESLEDLPERPVLLVSAGPGLSTATVFERARGRLTTPARPPNIQRFLRQLCERSGSLPPPANALLPAAGELLVTLPRLVRRLEELGGSSTMTGSGSVVFGIFEEEAVAQTAFERIRDERPGVWCCLSRTLSRREVETQRWTQ